MSSLQEQLLKAGLTTKQKARQANTDKRRQRKKQKSGVAVEPSLQQQIQQDIAQQKAEKQAKDAALNEQKKQALAQKEANLRIKQILEHHQVPETQGELSYNYTHQNKIKTAYVNDQTQQALIKGRLAICIWQEVLYIVTAETAHKVAELDSSVIAVLNEKSEETQAEQDDPYAEYQIPDDLMW